MLNAKNVVTIKDYKVFHDRQAEGYATEFSSFIMEGGRIFGFICGSYTSFEDDQLGQFTFTSTTDDFGKTWSEPQKFAEHFTKEPKRETLLLGGRMTAAGTLLVRGFHIGKGEEGAKFYGDVNYRQYDLIIGRKEAGAADFVWTVHPSGEFMGEQFMEGGVQLPDGRLVYAMWGMERKGENWQCGVLVSDDDGRSWKYNQVGYEPSMDIRNKPETPAGYNEQSLFVTQSGKIVSIIRGRDKLAQIDGSPRDTWFSRSESSDRGETWTKPDVVKVPGTGAAGVGLTLPDGSLLHACRIPYARDILDLPEPDFFGLHLARSFDEGRTWQTEAIIQRDPEGDGFDNYYAALNGQFLQTGPNEYHYIFGHYGKAKVINRLLALVLEIT